MGRGPPVVSKDDSDEPESESFTQEEKEDINSIIADLQGEFTNIIESLKTVRDTESRTDTIKCLAHRLGCQAWRSKWQNLILNSYHAFYETIACPASFKLARQESKCDEKLNKSHPMSSICSPSPSLASSSSDIAAEITKDINALDNEDEMNQTATQDDLTPTAGADGAEKEVDKTRDTLPTSASPKAAAPEKSVEFNKIDVEPPVIKKEPEEDMVIDVPEYSRSSPSVAALKMEAASVGCSSVTEDAEIIELSDSDVELASKSQELPTPASAATPNDATTDSVLKTVTDASLDHVPKPSTSLCTPSTSSQKAPTKRKRSTPNQKSKVLKKKTIRKAKLLKDASEKRKSCESSGSSTSYTDESSVDLSNDELITPAKKPKKLPEITDPQYKLKIAAKKDNFYIRVAKCNAYVISVAQTDPATAAMLIKHVEDSEIPPETPKKREVKKKIKYQVEQYEYSTDDDLMQPALPRFKNNVSRQTISDGDSTSDGQMSEPQPKKKKAGKTRKRPTKKANPLSSSDEDESDSEDNNDYYSFSDCDEASPNKAKEKKSPTSVEVNNKAAKEVVITSEKKKVPSGRNSNKSTSSSSRRNIKQILPESQLDKTTKESLLREKERLKRVAAKEKAYNELLASHPIVNPTAPVPPIVLEIDTKTKDVLVAVDPGLCAVLKEHQVAGVKFLWNCVIESCEKLRTTKGSGCILAHCMGAGKSVQLITFLHTLMANQHTKDHIKTCLLICPVNTFRNWTSEFEWWLKRLNLLNFEVFDFSEYKTTEERMENLKKWKENGGVMIIGINMYAKMVKPQTDEENPDPNEALCRECLADPGPDIVACDEGHMMKNELTKFSKSVKLIKTSRRIVLTGTPLQNNLEEYRAMVDFIKPKLLGSKFEFRNRFYNPINNGQMRDSTAADVRVMKKRCHILHKLLMGFVHRIDPSIMQQHLPEKFEYVLMVQMTELQMTMYRACLEQALVDVKKTKSMLKAYWRLLDIWSHPFLLYQKATKREVRKKKEKPGQSEDEPGDGQEKEVDCDTDQPSSAPDGEKDELAWVKSFINEEDQFKVELSTKMILLFSIIEECEKVGDKLLIFSQSVKILNLIEKLLKKHKSLLHSDSESRLERAWMKGRDFLRIDGSIPAEKRKEAIDKFNNEEDVRARIFLISSKAGGLGINLVGANRCVIFDASWNPSIDTQALFRIYRFGQKKTVYVYRLVAQGTLEEKIYNRQIVKESLSLNVVDAQQTDRHFDTSSIQEKFKFEPDVSKDRPTFIVPADNVLAAILQSQKPWIVSYHNHEDLLKNRPEEDLSEEERQQAWNEYEQEKDARAQQEKLQEEARKLKNAQANNSVQPNATEPAAVAKSLVDIGLDFGDLVPNKSSAAQGAPSSTTFSKQVRIDQPLLPQPGARSNVDQGQSILKPNKAVRNPPLILPKPSVSGNQPPRAPVTNASEVSTPMNTRIPRATGQSQPPRASNADLASNQPVLHQMSANIVDPPENRVDRVRQRSQISGVLDSANGIRVEDIVRFLKPQADGQLTADQVKAFFQIAFDIVVKDIQEESYLVSTDQPTDPRRMDLLIRRGKNLREQLQRLENRDFINDLLKTDDDDVIVMETDSYTPTNGASVTNGFHSNGDNSSKPSRKNMDIIIDEFPGL